MSPQRPNAVEFWPLLILFLFIIAGAAAQSAVETLPGYNGTLPFKLETGYISVGEEEEIQLFYYFIESETDANTDPLIFWITGGPGCSGFSGLAYEIGPLNFDLDNFDGSFPSFILNPYSWTKLASIIFIDAPVGTGFSYSTKPESYASTDTTTAKYNYMFLKKFMLAHPTFLKNRLYVAGDSYGGKIVPIIALHVVEGNEAGDLPRLPFQGYIVGNSRTAGNKDDNEIIPYAHRMALVSDEYFKLAKDSCDGEFANPDPDNILCTFALHLVNECTKNVNTGHILEPKCKFVSPPRTNGFQWSRLLLDDPLDLDLDPLLLSKQDESWCRNQNYVAISLWANDPTVQEALHIRKGTKTFWKRCNKTLLFEEDLESVLNYHRLLNEKGYQALVYSGDHDMVIPYMSTLAWVRALKLDIGDPWRAWNVDGQVAGYTETYQNNQAFLMFATIKGAGHTAPEYKPKECFEMLKRWLSLFPL